MSNLDDYLNMLQVEELLRKEDEHDKEQEGSSEAQNVRPRDSNTATPKG